MYIIKDALRVITFLILKAQALDIIISTIFFFAYPKTILKSLTALLDVITNDEVDGSYDDELSYSYRP